MAHLSTNPTEHSAIAVPQNSSTNVSERDTIHFARFGGSRIANYSIRYTYLSSIFFSLSLPSSLSGIRGLAVGRQAGRQ